ncbi:hypothetical protein ACVWXN_000249 [Bradyrhizobium sp. i1.4.4]
MQLRWDRPVYVGIDMTIKRLDVTHAEPGAEFIRDLRTTCEAQDQVEIRKAARADVRHCLSRDDLRQRHGRVEVVEHRKGASLQEDQVGCRDCVRTIGRDDRDVRVAQILLCDRADGLPIREQLQLTARQFADIPSPGIVRQVALEKDDGVPQSHQVLAEAPPQGSVTVAPGGGDGQPEYDDLHALAR